MSNSTQQPTPSESDRELAVSIASKIIATFDLDDDPKSWTFTAPLIATHTSARVAEATAPLNERLHKLSQQIDGWESRYANAKVYWEKLESALSAATARAELRNKEIVDNHNHFTAEIAKLETARVSDAKLAQEQAELIVELRAQLRTAREALEPFAKIAAELLSTEIAEDYTMEDAEREFPTSGKHGVFVTSAQLIAARAALASLREGETKQP